ncbi:hypothetical protein AUR65_011810 [Haloferax marisrubri]|uniref:Uncharacterized protein n=1 Tax=Haloferax marisrubri TaxID=1544719 RepID=A0A2P4NPM8_9EURY|nr:hypothetical protein AUR65_011810 [Haloferax marisrubri]
MERLLVGRRGAVWDRDVLIEAEPTLALGPMDGPLTGLTDVRVQIVTSRVVMLWNHVAVLGVVGFQLYVGNLRRFAIRSKFRGRITVGRHTASWLYLPI